MNNEELLNNFKSDKIQSLNLKKQTLSNLNEIIDGADIDIINMIKIDSQPVTDLITDLEGIKNEWIKVLTDLKKARDEYVKINSELRNIKKAMVASVSGFNIPWYRRVFSRKI